MDEILLDPSAAEVPAPFSTPSIASSSLPLPNQPATEEEQSVVKRRTCSQARAANGWGCAEEEKRKGSEEKKLISLLFFSFLFFFFLFLFFLFSFLRSPFFLCLPPPQFDTTLRKLSENSLVELLEGLETLLVYTKNLILFPDEKKYRKIKITNIHYQERLGHLQGAEEAMKTIGYVPQGEYLRLDESRIHHAGNEALLMNMEKQIVTKLNQLKKQWAAMPARTEPSHAFSCVQALGCHSAIGKRHNMEDDEIMIDCFGGSRTQGFFGLYDGHGGRATVDFVVKALHMNLEQHLKRHPTSDLASAFKHSYLTTDGQLRRQSILRSGSTSVTCVVRQSDDGKRMLHCANVGDSRAILCHGTTAVRLTIDHKASLPEEAKRIRDAGGFIGRNKRVNGVLAISRGQTRRRKGAGGGRGRMTTRMRNTRYSPFS